MMSADWAPAPIARLLAERVCLLRCSGYATHDSRRVKWYGSRHSLLSRNVDRRLRRERAYGRHAGVLPRRPLPGGNRMLEMTNENFARLLRGLTIAVGNRRNRYSCISFLRRRSGLCTVRMGWETTSPTKEP